ncbi:hypothetical protein [Streptomyces sp. NPDC000880]
MDKIAGHGSLITTQHYLCAQITDAGTALSAHLTMLHAPRALSPRATGIG